ncbi:MAG: HAD family hydrolase [Thermoplasmata archaeon]|nr:HAD family hydrolase [Thermoplasmata archaeon]
MTVRPGSPRFRAVFLDVGGTLVDERDYPMWVEIGREVGVELDEYHLAHAYLEVERETDTPHPPSHEERWRAVLVRASGMEVGPATAAEFYRAYQARPAVPRLYSDALRCLVQLQEDGRRLGVISNSRSEGSIRALLAQAGILPFFEVVVSSGTEGVAKPDPEIFRRAAVRMNVPVAEAFHVGDLAYRDARAAQAAGFSSVWLNREGTGFGEDPPEITSLTELPFLLLGLEGRLESTPGPLSGSPGAAAAEGGARRR